MIATAHDMVKSFACHGMIKHRNIVHGIQITVRLQENCGNQKPSTPRGSLRGGHVGSPDTKYVEEHYDDCGTDLSGIRDCESASEPEAEPTHLLCDSDEDGIELDMLYHPGLDKPSESNTHPVELSLPMFNYHLCECGPPILSDVLEVREGPGSIHFLSHRVHRDDGYTENFLSTLDLSATEQGASALIRTLDEYPTTFLFLSNFSSPPLHEDLVRTYHMLEQPYAVVLSLIHI